MTDDSTVTVAQLRRICWAVDHLAGIENQTRSLTLDMSQQMLADIIEGRGVAPVVDYVKRYCDVIDGSDGAERIAAEILAADGAVS